MTAAIKNKAAAVNRKAMLREPSVAASYINTLVEFAVANGADGPALLRLAAIEPATIDAPDARLPFSRLTALIGAAKHLCSDPAFALHFGADPMLYERTIVGLIIRSSSTMGEAMREFSRYARLVMDVDAGGGHERFAIVRNGAECWLEDRRRDPAEFSDLTEAVFARLICDSLRLFPDRPNFFKAVDVAHAAPSYRAEYERVLKAPVSFSAGRNAVLVDEAWFSEKVPTANRYSLGLFSQRASALFAALEGSTTVRGAVEEFLIADLHKGDATMSTVAAKLNMSAPTLYRRLREEGVAFETVLDELRFKLASQYLREDKLSVAETAYLVGFSDAASLSRAYKRWTGSGPRKACSTSLFREAL